jgi:hypothetical protein
MNKIIRSLLLLLCLTVIVAQPALAKFNSYYNTSNNIVFLDDPAAMPVCPAGSSTPFTPSSTKLDSSTMNRIIALKSVYMEASSQTKVPWQVYAAIDYREDNNNPTKSMLGGEPLGSKAVDSNNAPQTKLESIIIGSGILAGHAKQNYGVDITQPMNFDQLQKAFIGYNRGAAYKNAGVSPDKSPYVMNQYDASHLNMTFPNIPGETLAGITETGRFGAMTIFANIAEDGGVSAATCFGAGVGAKVDYSSIYPALDAGTLTADLLCVPRASQPSFKLLKGPACDSFIVMDQAYKTQFGVQMPVGQGYRSAAEQIACGGTKAVPKAGACIYYDPKNDPPEHLWGTAIDFTGPLTNSATPEHIWLVNNGPLYGWFWPNWAKNGQGGNAGVKEPWHFAYYFVGHNPASDTLEAFK